MRDLFGRLAAFGCGLAVMILFTSIGMLHPSTHGGAGMEISFVSGKRAPECGL
jgi:hypothetical protein